MPSSLRLSGWWQKWYNVVYYYTKDKPKQVQYECLRHSDTSGVEICRMCSGAAQQDAGLSSAASLHWMISKGSVDLLYSAWQISTARKRLTVLQTSCASSQMSIVCSTISYIIHVYVYIYILCVLLVQNIGSTRYYHCLPRIKPDFMLFQISWISMSASAG